MLLYRSVTPARFHCWSRHVTIKHIAPSLAKMVKVQKTKNNEDPSVSKIHIRPISFQRYKEWTMTSNRKLSRVENPYWQSCRCDGTSNGGTSHRLQGERHPLQPLWTLFSTLSWNVWRCQHSDNSEQLVSIWIGSCQSTLPRLSHHLSSVELCFGWHTVPVSSVLGL